MFTEGRLLNQYIQNAQLLAVKADGSYSYHSALES
jgi:hypothetical protein